MKYVVQCTKKIHCTKARLWDRGFYRPGDMVTYSGEPTRKLDEACIYEDDHSIDNGHGDFPFDDDYADGYYHSEFFKKVPIKVVRLTKHKKR